MQGIKVIEGNFKPQKARYGIAVARVNTFIVESLLEGAVDTLQRHGVENDDIEIVRVPGAYELPLVTQSMAVNGDYDAIIALGAVIRGETPHFDHVAGEAAKGLGHVALAHDMPIIFGVLTTDTIEQAIDRSGAKAGNKGAEAARTAIETVSLLNQLQN